MQAHTIAHVRSSWSRIQPAAPQAAKLFYEHLFATQPALRTLFKSDMAVQGARLMSMIDAAVAGLDDLPTLAPVLQQLGQRHAGYGVREEHYAAVGAALLETLSQGLGKHFTPEVREAWTQVYALVASTMIAAGHASGARPT